MASANINTGTFRMLFENSTKGKPMKDLWVLENVWTPVHSNAYLMGKILQCIMRQISYPNTILPLLEISTMSSSKIQCAQIHNKRFKSKQRAKPFHFRACIRACVYMPAYMFCTCELCNRFTKKGSLFKEYYLPFPYKISMASVPWSIRSSFVMTANVRFPTRNDMRFTFQPRKTISFIHWPSPSKIKNWVNTAK